MTPSYFLVYLYTSIDSSPGIDARSGRALEETSTPTPEATTSTSIAARDGPKRHCRPHGGGQCCHYGDVDPSGLEEDIEDAEQRHEKEMEAICEDLCGNCPF